MEKEICSISRSLAWYRSLSARRRKLLKIQVHKNYLKNKEKINLRSKEYRRNNKEKMKLLNRRWRKRNPDKVKNLTLKYLYGISLKEYLTMITEQDGKCAICNIKEPLTIDHNHVTSKIRKLLCGRCNRVLGLIKEDINILNNMSKYLIDNK